MTTVESSSSKKSVDNVASRTIQTTCKCAPAVSENLLSQPTQTTEDLDNNCLHQPELLVIDILETEDEQIDVTDSYVSNKSSDLPVYKPGNMQYAGDNEPIIAQIKVPAGQEISEDSPIRLLIRLPTQAELEEMARKKRQADLERERRGSRVVTWPGLVSIPDSQTPPEADIIIGNIQDDEEKFFTDTTMDLEPLKPMEVDDTDDLNLEAIFPEEIVRFYRPTGGPVSLPESQDVEQCYLHRPFGPLPVDVKGGTRGKVCKCKKSEVELPVTPIQDEVASGHTTDEHSEPPPENYQYPPKCLRLRQTSSAPTTGPCGKYAKCKMKSQGSGTETDDEAMSKRRHSEEIKLNS